MAGKVTIRELLVKLGIDADDKAVTAFDERLEGVKSTMRGVIRMSVKLVAGFAAAGAGAIAEAERVGRYGEELTRTAETLGMTTTRLQELHHTADNFELPAGRFNEAIVQMTSRIGAMGDGSGQGADTLKLLGLEAQKMAKMRPGEMFNEFAEAVSKVEDPTKKVAATTAIFGDQLGEDILPLLRLGKDGLAEYAKQAHALGVVMDESAIATAVKYRKMSKRLIQVLRGVRNSFAVSVMPSIMAAGETMTNWLMVNREVIKAKTATTIEALKDAFEKVKAAAEDVNDFVNDKIGGWGNVFEGIASAIAAAGVLKIILAIKGAIGAIMALVGGAGGVLAAPFLILAAKVIAVIAVIVGLVLVIQDLFTYLRGGDSVIGRFIEKWKDSEGALGTVARYVQSLIRLFKVLIPIVADGLVAAFEFWWSYAGPIFGFLIDILKTIVTVWFAAWMGAIETLTGVFNFLADTIENWDSIVERVIASVIKKFRELQDMAREVAVAIKDAVPGGDLAFSLGQKAGGAINDLFGPSPEMAARSSQTNTSNFAMAVANSGPREIKVEAPPGSDSPEAYGEAVDKALRDHEDRQLKQARDEFLGGSR